MMRRIVPLIALLALGSTAAAQTPEQSNAAILARIAELEQEIAALKARLAPPPMAGATRPPTLAEASAEAKKTPHVWPDSTNTYTNSDLKPAPPVAPPPPSPPAAVVSPSEREAYEKIARKDEAYWKDRMQAVRAKLDDDRTFLAEAERREAALARRAHGGLGDSFYAPDRLTRAQVDAQWQEAVAEVGRLKALVLNDRRAITTAEEEARRANVPPGWLRP